MSYKVKSPIPVIEGGTGDATFTDHAVLIGDVVAGIKTVGPGSVSGVPLIAQGVSADPIFGIANVVGGGTGGSTFTAYSLIAAGTTSTSSFQNVSGVGTAGQILTSNGAGALPTWQSGAGATVSITGDSGGAIVSGSFTFTGGTTGLTFAGAGTTETLGGRLVVSNGGTGATTLTGVLIGNGTGPITANAITQYNTLIGGASNSITSIAPSVTSGIPFVSQGSAANPTFGTAVVAGGGTGNTVLSNHGVLLGQGTSPIVTTAVGTTGQVFTGVTGADPVWASPAASSISITGNSGGALTGNTFTFTGGTTGLTFSGAGSTETLGGDLVVANGGTGNTTFTAYSVLCAGTTATGAFQNVSGVGTTGQVLTSNGAGALPTWQTGGGGGSGITTINGDVGSVTGSTVTISGDGGFNYAGSSVRFESAATTLSLLTSDVNSNTFIGSSAGTTTASGSDNTGIGVSSLGATTSGSFNAALGYASLGNFESGSTNVSIGYQSALNLVSGSDNTILGASAGTSYTSSENSNIVIGSGVSGVAAESNVLRIGSATGTSSGNLNKAFICGIDGINVGSVAKVLTMASDQIGTATITAGTGITVTPGANTITIAASSAGFIWSTITADQTAAINNGYICNKAGTLALALPAVSAVGSIIEVIGINNATGWRITQASGQQIFFGASSTTLGTGGSLASSATRDGIRIVCITANTTWQVTPAPMGNITVV